MKRLEAIRAIGAAYNKGEHPPEEALSVLRKGVTDPTAVETKAARKAANKAARKAARKAAKEAKAQREARAREVEITYGKSNFEGKGIDLNAGNALRDISITGKPNLYTPPPKKKGKKKTVTLRGFGTEPREPGEPRKNRRTRKVNLAVYDAHRENDAAYQRIRAQQLAGLETGTSRFDSMFKAIINSQRPAIAAAITETEAPVISAPKAPVTSKQQAAAEIIAKEPTPYNEIAYVQALRTMTRADAWKLAKDPEASQAFLTALNNPAPVAVAIVETIAPVEEVAAAPVATPAISPRGTNVKATGTARQVTTTQRDPAEQLEFKRRVWANFAGRCAICGDSSDVNEGAHLESWERNHDNSTDNGVLLSPTFHRMLDRGLMAIHPESLTIHFKEEGVFKSLFEGKEIGSHSVPLNKAHLAKIWEKFTN
ncbi:TPA: HNH endonuclease [Klebsiella variicola subsp. variicola]|nr:HNH endonuclease [Klebsiella variicola subsp. variicola]